MRPDRADPVAAEEIRRLADERRAEYVRRVVDDLPPLTEAQRTKLAALFAPAVGEVAARRRNGTASRRGKARTGGKAIDGS